MEISDSTLTDKTKKRIIRESKNNWDIASQPEFPKQRGKDDMVSKQEKAKIRLNQIKLSGHLQKWINVIRGWKRLYFSLHNGTLKYSNRKKDIDDKAFVINLTNAVVLKQRNSHRFVIDTGSLIFNLRAKYHENQKEWVASIVETQELLKIINPAPTRDLSATSLAIRNPRRESTTIDSNSRLILDGPPSSRRESLMLDGPVNPRKSYSFDVPPLPRNPILESITPRRERERERDNVGDGVSTVRGTPPSGDYGRREYLLDGQNSNRNSNEHQPIPDIQILSPRSRVQEILRRLKKIRQELSKIHSDGNLPGGPKKKKRTSTKKKRGKDDSVKVRDELLESAKALINEATELIQTLDNLDNKTVKKKKLTRSDSKERKSPHSKKLNDDQGTKTTSEDETSSEEYFDVEEEDWVGNASDESGSSTSGSARDFFSDLSIGEEKAPERGSSAGERLTSHRARIKNPITVSKRTLVSSLKSLQVAPPPPVQVPGANLDDILSWYPDDFTPRTLLPHFRNEDARLNIGKFLKDAIGKDLTRISMPVVFSEPLSLLQRLAEEYGAYSVVLEKALRCDDSPLRLAYVASFAVSCYSSTPDRLYKPFNPILGETYELIDKQKRWRLLSEQVSHHPPVSACICEGEGWTVWGHAEVKTKFWGKSLEIFPVGSQTVTFPRTGDQFVWNKVTTIINNVVLGNKWVDHYGEMILINRTTGDKCKLNFEKTSGSWFGGATAVSSRVTGIVYDKVNQPRYRIEGTWTDALDAIPYTKSGDLDERAKIRIWESAPWPSFLKEQYNYTSFAIAENELPAFLKPYLPISDSRWRPDQRAFENGDFDKAQEEKTRLEVLQREQRKFREENNVKYKAKWFKMDKESKTYVYKGGYWEQRMKRNWESAVNVFGLDLQSEDFNRPILETIQEKTTTDLEQETEDLATSASTLMPPTTTPTAPTGHNVNNE